MGVVLIFVVFELTNNFVLEPILYGYSVGISEVALIIMVAFWTWLWGPIGLVLATPLTVCLVVISKYIPELQFVSLLFGTEPILKEHGVFYQRLVAKDVKEVAEIAEEYQKTHTLELFFQDLLIPALVFARHDLAWQKLSDEEFQTVLLTLQQIVDTTKPLILSNGAEKSSNLKVLGCPADDKADELCLHMLSKLLTCCEVKVCSCEMLASEMVAEAQAMTQGLVCIVELPSGRPNAARQLSKLFRARLPGTKLILGAWGLHQDAEEVRASLTDHLADYVGQTISETANQILHLARLPAASSTDAEKSADAESPALAQS
jgi:hypothetical protein